MTSAYDRKRAKSNFVRMLEDELDNPLTARGFSRRSGSTIYKRQLVQVIQEISVYADYFPRYEPAAQAHVHANFALKMPEVSKEALRLVGGNKWLLANAPEIIVNQPIEFAAPKEQRERWFAYETGDYSRIGRAICMLIEQWLSKLLEEFESPEDLIAIYEKSDDRVLMQRHSYIYVAAAYMLKGMKDKAREVMVENLGSPGLRKIYAPVYENLNAKNI